MGAIESSDMKAVVPSILEAKEWTSWMNQAKKELMANPLLTSPHDSDVYLLDPPRSATRRNSSRSSEANGISTTRFVVSEFISSKGDVESDYFLEMVGFFSEFFFEENGVSKPIVVTNDVIMSSYLLLEELVKKQGMHFVALPEAIGFVDLFERSEDIYEVFAPIRDSELKKSFIDHIVDEIPSWPKVLMEIFPGYLTSYIPDIFRQNKKNADLLKLYKDAVENFKDKGATLIYLLRTATRSMGQGGYTKEQLLYIQLQLLDAVNRYIDAKRDAPENRKNSKALMNLLLTISRSSPALKKVMKRTPSESTRLWRMSSIFPWKENRGQARNQRQIPGFKFFDEARSPSAKRSFPPDCSVPRLLWRRKRRSWIISSTLNCRKSPGRSVQPARWAI